MSVDDNNWDELDEEYEYEDVDDVLAFDDDDEDYDDGGVVLEAVKRIEQAKLYESLLKHDFFAPGSAREEILDKVTNEIRTFILSRLEELMGMRQPASTVAVESPFSPEQTEALLSIAERLISKKQPQTATEVQLEPSVQQYESITTEPRVNPAKVATPTVNQAGQANKVPPRKRKRRRKKEQIKKTEDPQKYVQDKQLTGSYKKPALNPNAKPMPTEAEMATRYSVQASRNAGGNSTADKLMSLAIQGAQMKNKNIVED